jgi:hypothetical protein
MNGDRWIRAGHRWVSIAFTVAVIANLAFLAIGHGRQPPGWVTYAPLLPLGLLMLSGIYMLARHHVIAWRGRAGERR